MKYSKEFKVGILTIVAGVILYFGLDFLKGKDLFSSDIKLYLKLDNVENLTPSIPVKNRGFDIGKIEDVIKPQTPNDKFLVVLSLKSDYNLPKNSIATVSSNPLLGTAYVNIISDTAEIKNISKDFKLSAENTFYKAGDTIQSPAVLGIFDKAKEYMKPVAAKIDSLKTQVVGLYGSKEKKALSDILVNVQVLTKQMALMVSENRNNLNKITKNTKDLTENINDIMGSMKPIVANLKGISDTLKNNNLNELTSQLTSTMKTLQTTVAAYSDSSGTIGGLLYKKDLYNNLNTMVEDFDFLAADFQANPHRYVNINLVGKKPVESELIKRVKPSKVKGGEQLEIELKRSTSAEDVKVFFMDMTKKEKSELVASQASSTSLYVTLPANIEKGEHALQVVWNNGKDNDYFSLTKK